MQRYEGGFTIYGPYTLPAYIQEFNKLAVALAQVPYHSFVITPTLICVLLIGAVGQCWSSTSQPSG